MGAPVGYANRSANSGLMKGDCVRREILLWMGEVELAQYWVMLSRE